MRALSQRDVWVAELPGDDGRRPDVILDNKLNLPVRRLLSRCRQLRNERLQAIFLAMRITFDLPDHK
jgi:hypothetical protein